MDLINIYKCLCDPQRLRILNLLKAGPLCVCHLQEVLDETQVKISKQLAYMKRLKMVEAERSGNWMIYRIPSPAPALLVENLKCLQDSSREYPVFKSDLKKRDTVIRRIRKQSKDCPELVADNNCC